jgi:putative signal transducing protein
VPERRECPSSPPLVCTVSGVAVVTLTVVHDESEAEMVSGLLRANGIECSYRKTDIAAGAWTGGFARGGPVEVLVTDDDLVAARALLPTS